MRSKVQFCRHDADPPRPVGGVLKVVWFRRHEEIMMPTHLRRQTFMAKKGQVDRNWCIVDATDQSLGRLASDVAVVLMGKHRPEYTPHVDTGDFVIVVNAGKVALTGRKADQKLKMRYSGHPGGLKAQTYGHVREHKPETLIQDAVRRMLPKNRLGRVMLSKLKVYAGPDHPHSSQHPTELKI